MGLLRTMLHTLSGAARRMRANRLLRINDGRERMSEAALASLERAALIDPSRATVRVAVRQLLRSGARERARKVLERALSVRQDAALLNDLGILLAASGEHGPAEERYQDAVRADPEYPTARVNLGRLYLRTGRPAEAARSALQALALAPDFMAAVVLRVEALTQLRDFAGAIALAERCSSGWVRPDLDLLRAAAFCYFKADRLFEARRLYARLLSLSPGAADVWDEYGVVLGDLGSYPEAFAAWERAIVLEPGGLPARFHRGAAYLALKRFTEGWEEYELRLKSLARIERKASPPPLPKEVAPGARVLVLAEQGLGDEIMFASLLPDLLAVGAQITLNCSKCLESLFSRSFPSITVIGSKANDICWPAGVCLDYKVHLASLAGRFRPSACSFPDHGGYLSVDSGRRQYWAGRLAALPGRLKFGLSWRGGDWLTNRARRTLGTSELTRILRLPGVSFVNLQYDSGAEEVATLAEQTGGSITHWPEALADYDETAALVSALDGVVTVCTAVVHLGGALGKPVMVLVHPGPEWRYGTVGEKMDWYPSVRLYRADWEQGWEPALQGLESAWPDVMLVV